MQQSNVHVVCYLWGQCERETWRASQAGVTPSVVGGFVVDSNENDDLDETVLNCFWFSSGVVVSDCFWFSVRTTCFGLFLVFCQRWLFGVVSDVQSGLVVLVCCWFSVSGGCFGL